MLGLLDVPTCIYIASAQYIFLHPYDQRWFEAHPVDLLFIASAQPLTTHCKILMRRETVSTAILYLAPATPPLSRLRQLHSLAALEVLLVCIASVHKQVHNRSSPKRKLHPPLRETSTRSIPCVWCKL